MSDRIAQNLAANIRRLREARGLSQQQMADLSGVPRPTWANLESGDANPTISVLTKVADALQVGVQDLLGTQGELVHYPARTLSEKQCGRARVRRLSPAGQGNLELERLDLPAAAEVSGKPHPIGMREYLVCEKGELELQAAGQTVRVRCGDVVAFHSAEPHLYKNPGRTQAVAYTLLTFAPVHG